MLVEKTIGIRWLSGGIRAWLQETCSLCHTHSEYPLRPPPLPSPIRPCHFPPFLRLSVSPFLRLSVSPSLCLTVSPFLLFPHSLPVTVAAPPPSPPSPLRKLAVVPVGDSAPWHRNHPAPHAHLLSRRSLLPQAGCRRWMQDVVCELVGIAMVLWYVMNIKGFWCAKQHGNRFHVNSMQHHVWSMLPSTLQVLW